MKDVMKDAMKDPVTLRREAAEWFVAIHDSPELPTERLADWLRWFEASAENQRAFEDVARVWHSVTPAIIAPSRDNAPEDDYDGSISIEAWRTRINHHVHEPSRRRRWMKPLLAAAAAMAMITLINRELLSPGSLARPIASGEFRTDTGEHMQLLLADGSNVTLGARSHLVVDFSSTGRTLRLDSGEAFFDVRKDPARPFRVLAFDGAITAVGTAFNVRALDNRVTVTVTEGVVRVDSEKQQIAAELGLQLQKTIDPQEIPTLRVAGGEQLTYSGGAKADPRAVDIEAAPIRRVDPSESARWRDGWLVYRNEPLKYVAADISRYTVREVVVADSAAGLLFSGAVFKDRAAEWLVALPQVSAVTVETQGDRIVIKARESLLVRH